MNTSNFPIVWYKSCSVATPKLPEPVPPENYHRIATLPPGFPESLLSWHNKIPPPQLHHLALITPDTHKRAISEPQSLTTMLGSHRQACGCRGTLVHATSPRWSVPLIKGTKDPRKFKSPRAAEIYPADFEIYPAPKYRKWQLLRFTTQFHRNMKCNFLVWSRKHVLHALEYLPSTNCKL